MKTLKIFLLTFSLLCASTLAFTQKKAESFQVAGECGMCKKTIEKAAKNAGASYALWNVRSKELTVKYETSASNSAKIQKAVADAGYDTPDYKASDEAYNKLHACCQYERTSNASSSSCCDDQKCGTAACKKDGKCASDSSCCKESGCAEKDCCKKA